MVDGRKTIRIHAQAIYRDAATTVRARIAADGTLLITRRAYLAAKSRACYAGTDELHLLPAAGHRDWSEAQGLGLTKTWRFVAGPQGLTGALN
jgi:hypothetical protein